MPMDGTNTLKYFYNNQSESVNKYLEILATSFEIARGGINWDAIDQGGNGSWNTNIPKIIDNAILNYMRDIRD